MSPKIIPGIKEAHNEHKELVECIDRLKCMIGKSESREAIENELYELRTIATRHFSLEENLMLKVNYPGFDKHKLQHTALLQSLSTLISKFEGEEFIGLTDETISFLEKWFTGHLKTADFEMATYCQTRGAS